MKLIYCEHCHDVVKLTLQMRFCMCGRVFGQYLNNVEAEVSKTAVSLAIGNGSLDEAIQNMKVFMEHHKDELTTREAFQHIGKIDYAWVRPNEGGGNPHTKVSEMDIRTVAFAHVSLINPTNTQLNGKVVRSIVVEGWNPEKGQAFPAKFEDGRFTITDGNHRLEALKQLGQEYAPIVLISEAEFRHVAYQKKRKLNLMVHIPDLPRFYTAKKHV